MHTSELDVRLFKLFRCSIRIFRRINMFDVHVLSRKKKYFICVILWGEWDYRADFQT